MTVSADVPTAQTGAEQALDHAESLGGLARDFDNLCDEALEVFGGRPKVDGMDEFQSEYKTYMDTVEEQGTDIAENMHSTAGEIGETDNQNNEEFSGRQGEIPNVPL